MHDMVLVWRIVRIEVNRLVGEQMEMKHALVKPYGMKIKVPLEPLIFCHKAAELFAWARWVEKIITGVGRILKMILIALVLHSWCRCPACNEDRADLVQHSAAFITVSRALLFWAKLFLNHYGQDALKSWFVINHKFDLHLVEYNLKTRYFIFKLLNFHC